MPLPTFICTGDSYFKEKEYHLNTMIKAKGLPTLFITLTMAENKWIHLTEILRNTDNHSQWKKLHKHERGNKRPDQN